MRIVLTGGGTGGHIYPALAIGDKFRSEDPDCEVIYITSGEPLEYEIIPAHGYKMYIVNSFYLDRGNPITMAVTVYKTLKGKYQSLRILKKFKADAVISTGGFIGYPVLLAANRLRIPYYLHEQNSFPGVANKVSAGKARKVFLGFEAAKERFKRKDNLVYSGNPVRSEFTGRSKEEDRRALGIKKGDLCILIFGGSQGSDAINRIGERLASEYAGKDGYTVIWGMGSDYYESADAKLRKECGDAGNIWTSAYIKNMPEVLSAADIVISRSGALSVAETAATGTAAIFVPSPNVTEDHQYYNAKTLADAGGAVIIREKDDKDETAEEVLAKFKKLDADRSLIEFMGQSAAKIAGMDSTGIIYRTIMETYR